MTPEIKRILKLVEKGKLTSLEGIELIEGLEKEGSQAVEPEPESVEEVKAESKSKKSKAKSESSASEEPAPNQKSEHKPPKELMGSFWEALCQGFEELNKLKFNFSLTHLDRYREVRTPLNLTNNKTVRIEGLQGRAYIRACYGLDEAVSRIVIGSDATAEARKAADGYELVVEDTDDSIIIHRPDMPEGVRVFLDIHLKRPSVGPLVIEPLAETESKPADEPKKKEKPKAKPVTKTEILEQLERGEISAAEAKRKMKEGEQA